MTSSPNPSPPLRLVASWLLVLIPLGWGVYQSVVKSLPLFHQAPAATRSASSSTEK